MLNYSNLVGYAIEDEIANLYVPGARPICRQRGALLHRPRHRPIDNFVSEFLPDVARHIHVQIVVIQRIINQVAKTDATNGQP